MSGVGGVDPCGVPYDGAWTDDLGVVHYHRHLGGRAPARWTSDYDVNPICGCHLGSKCGGCGVCTYCDGCYCYEGDEW